MFEELLLETPINLCDYNIDELIKNSRPKRYIKAMIIVTVYFCTTFNCNYWVKNPFL